MDDDHARSITRDIVVGVVVLVLGAAALGLVNLGYRTLKGNGEGIKPTSETRSSTLPTTGPDETTTSSAGTVTPTTAIPMPTGPVDPVVRLLGDCNGGLVEINRYGGWDCRPYAIGSSSFDRSLTNRMVDHYDEQWIEFDLGGDYSALDVVVGVANESEPGTKALLSIVANDSTTVWSGELKRGESKELMNLDVQDVTMLKLAADPIELGPDRHAELFPVFGEPTVSRS